MSDKFEVSRVMVIGAGVMGSGIAAHLASAGFSVSLLDILPPEGLTEEDIAAGLDESSPEWRNRLAIRGIERALKHRPPLFYDPEDAELIIPGNIEDDLPLVSEVDWVIEAIPEVKQLKLDLYRRIEHFLKPGVIVSSNTSGILLEDLLEGADKLFERQFLITHFFNPVRYMKLLEIVASDSTDPAIVEAISNLAREKLGKGVVMAKNTPGFIANRIGVHALVTAASFAVDMGIAPEVADKLTGVLIGRAPSGTFRTIDLVGLDTLGFVVKNLYEALEHDRFRSHFRMPKVYDALVEKKLFGNKTGAGFYKVERTDDGKKLYLSIDYDSLEYTPQQRPQIEAAGKSVGDRIKSLIESDTNEGKYLWKVVSSHLLYAAWCLVEIADRPYMVDDAMKWGYNWSMGPFELWDELGVEWMAKRLKEDGAELPDWFDEVLKAGTFYRLDAGKLEDFDPVGKSYRSKPKVESWLSLAEVRANPENILASNEQGALLDLGDDVWLLEFRSKMNTITEPVMDMMELALDRSEQAGKALVIGNEGKAFCAGANLAMLLEAAERDDYERIDSLVHRFQDITQRIKFSNIPVVSAPFGLCLGGGTEIALHSDACVIDVETRMGLVECGAGVLPSGGGAKELYANLESSLGTEGPMPILLNLFDMFLFAYTSPNAKDARKQGFITKGDEIVFDTNSLIYKAKQTAKALLEQGYTPPKKRTFLLPGKGGYAVMMEHLAELDRLGKVMPHDKVIGEHIATMLSGGDVLVNGEISEDAWLELERAMFVDLTRTEETKERMRYILKTGKPLRN